MVCTHKTSAKMSHPVAAISSRRSDRCPQASVVVCRNGLSSGLAAPADLVGRRVGVASRTRAGSTQRTTVVVKVAVFPASSWVDPSHPQDCGAVRSALVTVCCDHPPCGALAYWAVVADAHRVVDGVARRAGVSAPHRTTIVVVMPVLKTRALDVLPSDGLGALAIPLDATIAPRAVQAVVIVSIAIWIAVAELSIRSRSWCSRSPGTRCTMVEATRAARGAQTYSSALVCVQSRRNGPLASVSVGRKRGASVARPVGHMEPVSTCARGMPFGCTAIVV